MTRVCCCTHTLRQHDTWSKVCRVPACAQCSYFGCPKPAPATDSDVREFVEGIGAQREGEGDIMRAQKARRAP